jgi:imidazolonepropionase-like amidohydrolase
LLQEAGFHPLEVIRSATFNGAALLSEQQNRKLEFGLIRPGFLADLVIVPENPLANFKVLYGTGAIRLNEQTNTPERVGGIKYTIKDGIIYDAKQLLADVEKIVETAKASQKNLPTGNNGAAAVPQRH